MSIFQSNRKADPFEHRCGFLGPEIMELIKDRYDKVGLYINDIYVNFHNPSRLCIETIRYLNEKAITLYVVKMELFVSHYDNMPKLNLYFKSSVEFEINTNLYE